jgi:hypothetical protein
MVVKYGTKGSLSNPSYGYKTCISILTMPAVKTNENETEVKNVKAGLKKVALTAATLFLLAILVAPSTSASSLTATGDSSYIPVSSISGYATSEPSFEAQSPAEESVADAEPQVEESGVSERSAETQEETQTDAPQVDQDPSDSYAIEPQKGQGKSNGHGKGLLKKM